MKFLSKINLIVLLALFAGHIHVATAMVMPVKEITEGNRTFLKKFLIAERDHDLSKYANKGPQALESLIEIALAFIEDPYEFKSLRKELSLNKKKLIKLFNNLIDHAEKTINGVPLKPKQKQQQPNKKQVQQLPAPKPQNNQPKIKIPAVHQAVQQPPFIPVSQPNIVPSAQPPIITSPMPTEEIVEEIKANRLYIGLDIQACNTNGQEIMWQEPANALSSQMPKDATFFVNDYFHITIAWYESKDSLSQQFIEKVKKALNHATEILKIIYPKGITGIALLDSAILLGRKKDAVAYRVAQSIELKQLQDIILKFISFENITNFKFSTFEPGTPLHATLGRIMPSKFAKTFQQVAHELNAPRGARASKGESFSSNSFRLTYSTTADAWQELMSYTF